MYQAEHLLILHPANPETACTQKELITLLKEIQFIDAEEILSRFQIGDKFLQQVTFLGCSPNIELSPNGDQAYVYVEIPQTTSEISFHSGKNLKFPRCPHCKETLKNIAADIAEANVINSLSCLACKETFNPLGFNWRKSAFFGKCQVIIGNIYDAEAVPNENLLSYLAKLTNDTWKYSYIRR
ncbi:MAG: Unknown protein [uncultured Thiotrichaceae bacterium]|uniref:Uncharacterized protein n=1 Tax=uncultured Thiotrichaceae bacterium TaxID=298394 RepID=A0A6S6SCG3_9GAMM|nr:MAG: Unknown protein [uncultured Thiotrichaceae bacterium]